MNEDKTKNQAPILRFLNKHKWRIILPILISTLYYGIPACFEMPEIRSYNNIFITSNHNATNTQLQDEIAGAAAQIRSEEFFHDVVAKYDLFAEQRKNGVDEKVLDDTLQRSMYVSIQGYNLENGVPVSVSVSMKEDPQKLAALNKEMISVFESQPNFKVVSKFIPPAYPMPFFKINPLSSRILVEKLLLGLEYAILLIFIWEIPFLFFSPNTKEMVFEPLKADWQSELIDAKLRNQTWKAFEINARYSYAYLAAIIQKSPVGSLIESISRFAKL